MKIISKFKQLSKIFIMRALHSLYIYYLTLYFRKIKIFNWRLKYESSSPSPNLLNFFKAIKTKSLKSH